jgi:hypothetical protein
VLPFHDEKAGARCESDDIEDDAVPHLDGTPIRPTLEMATNPLGSIAELPAMLPSRTRGSGDEERGDPERQATTPSKDATTTKDPKDTKRDSGDRRHVLSWAAYDGSASRNAAARLSSPPAVPDPSVAVWSNMNDKTKGSDAGVDTPDEEPPSANEVKEEVVEEKKDSS